MTDQISKYANVFAAEIKRFQGYVGRGTSARSEELNELSQILSNLLALGEGCPLPSPGNDLSSPEVNRDDLIKTLQLRFPNFGFYNSCRPIDEPIGEISVTVGDAIDDLLDIYQDLAETLWHIENDAPDLGLFQAKTLFFHWGRHALDLKSYLHQLIYEEQI